MKHVGGGTYELEFDDDAPKADCWIYEDVVSPNKRPNTLPVAEKMFAGLDPDAIYKIVRGNAIRMLHLDLV